MSDPVPMSLEEVLGDVAQADLDAESKRVERERKERQTLWKSTQAAQGLSNTFTTNELVTKLTGDENLPDIRPKKAEETPNAKPAPAPRGFPAPPRR